MDAHLLIPKLTIVVPLRSLSIAHLSLHHFIFLLSFFANLQPQAHDHVSFYHFFGHSSHHFSNYPFNYKLLFAGLADDLDIFNHVLVRVVYYLGVETSFKVKVDFVVYTDKHIDDQVVYCYDDPLVLKLCLQM